MKYYLIIIAVFFPVFLNAQGFLHADGKNIVNGNNENIILRGIGTGNWMLMEGYMMKTEGVAGTQHEIRERLEDLIGTEKTDSFFNAWLANHFTRTDVDSMKAWGFNSVRVAMHYKWFTLPIEDEPVEGENTWLDKGFVMMDSLLSWCTDNEMYLILDLHGAPGGQGANADISDYDSNKPSLWESQENKDKTVWLWRKLAERYSTEEWIGGYDLINETNWSFPEGNNSQIRELFGRITDTIREIDTNHIIFIEGNSYANDHSGLTPPWDDNLVYSFHKYWSGTGPDDLDWIISLRDTHNVPLWLGESGENSNAWYTDLIDLCESNNIGWSWWPVKKNSLNNVLSVTINKEYEDLVKYWKGEITTAPTEEEAFQAVLKWADNHKIENCNVQYDVIDAMIRQAHTNETKPFKIHKLGNPIFFSDYDYGKYGFAYSDEDIAYYGGTWTAWNTGWGLRSDGVDIEICEDVSDTTNGYNVGWTEDNEWMLYSLTSDSVAAYTLSIRHASLNSGTKVQFEVNGVKITDIIELPSTGGWQKWETKTINQIILPDGDIKIKCVIIEGGANLSYFNLHSPISANEVDFKFISAKTSLNGYNVYIDLNKEITTNDTDLNINHFNFKMDEVEINLTDIALSPESNRVIILTHEKELFSDNVLSLTYEGNSIQSLAQYLNNFSNQSVQNNLEVSHTLPGRIQAEDFLVNNGLVLEGCEDSGGGQNTGYSNGGDYLVYKAHVLNSGNYKINYRVATERGNAELVFQIGEGDSYTSIDTMKFTSTGGWQKWETQSSSRFYLDEGYYLIRLYVKQGEHNLNWFELVSVTTGLNKPINEDSKMTIFPNPANEYVMIKSESNSDEEFNYSIINSSGQFISSGRISENQEINVSNFRNGMYYLRIHENEKVYTRKLIIRK